MKKNIFFQNLLFLFLLTGLAHAQVTTAYDFTMDDCNGKMHCLFDELDSGNVIIMEYFMISCSPCIKAGNDIEKMLIPLRAKYKNKVRFYQFGFTNTYTCTQVKNWVSTNGFTSVPFDSGGVQVAYYGGMGMPTTAVVAGSEHKVLFTNTGFDPGDTTIMSKEIHTFFDSIPLTIKNAPSHVSDFSCYPNPAFDKLTLQLHAEKSGMLWLVLETLDGKKVMDISEERIKAGTWSKTISLPILSNGFYLLHGNINGEKFTHKIAISNK